MGKAIPNIQKFMTVMPHTIGSDQTLEKAEKMMSEYKIRHLPVMEGGRLVGILSDRDLKFLETFKDIDPKKTLVSDAYTSDPYTTTPTANLADVCEHMAAHKFGAVLVVDNKKLVGIFTWVDALKAMGDLMKTRLQ